MGSVYVTYLRLTNSTFCLIWATMNHFEAPVAYAGIFQGGCDDGQGGDLF